MSLYSAFSAPIVVLTRILHYPLILVRLMQKDTAGTGISSVEPAIVDNVDVSLALVLSGENAMGTNGVNASAAMSGVEKNIDQEVCLAFLNGDGDGEESSEDIDEVSVPFASGSICNEEGRDAFKKVGRRRTARESKQISGLKSSAAYEKEKFAIHSVSQRLIRGMTLIAVNPLPRGRGAPSCL